ncbi:uncharacterized protein LOC124639660 [Helicoverpa zea]|uniref:uncharacterized protein LOC124639660 n=1 Tax=Helicoverpa zea TaxID=7113 RepID=UPI001F568633|nr:uncharacterized protein LOC124639660 [Helicoverpa zea]
MLNMMGIPRNFSLSLIMTDQSEQPKQEKAKQMEYFGIYRKDSLFVRMEKIFRKILTPVPELISQDPDPMPRLQYLPDYIADLIRRKKDLKRQWDENPHDRSIEKNYHQLREDIRTRIRHHAAILKYFDFLTKTYQRGEEKNHFSTAIDTDHVQSLVNYFREHEDDRYLLLIMFVTNEFTRELGTQRELEDKSEPIHYYYFWYAIYATYGDFVLTPPRHRKYFKSKSNSQSNLDLYEHLYEHHKYN